MTKKNKALEGRMALAAANVYDGLIKITKNEINLIKTSGLDDNDKEFNLDVRNGVLDMLKLTARKLRNK